MYKGGRDTVFLFFFMQLRRYYNLLQQTPLKLLMQVK